MRYKDYYKIKERLYHEQLSNGLSLYVIEKNDYNKSLAFFAANYGGADRRFKLKGEWIDTPSGVAHFLEHKMFDMEGGRNALTELSGMGASANAFTSSAMTAYHFTGTENFDDCLKLLLEFVSTPYFTEESVRKEQGIIGQEIRMTEDNPAYALYYGLLKSVFKTNPVRDSVAGSVESIAEITADTLYDCHRVFYSPANMALCVIGNQEPDKVRIAAEKLLPDSPGLPPERDYGGRERLTPWKKKKETVMEVGVPMFFMGGKTERAENGKPLLRQELTAELALRTLMGSSSPLYTRLYSEGLLNQELEAEFDTEAGTAYTVFGGESRDPEKVCDEICAECLKTGKHGMDAQYFERQKKALLGEKIMELNSFDRICYNMVSGCFRKYEYFDTLQTLEKITESDVCEFIRRELSPDRFAVSIVRNK